MRVEIRPAKRHGHSRTIFDAELAAENLAADVDGMIISIDAEPLHRKSRYHDNSRYHYDIFLSAGEIVYLARRLATS